MSEDLLGKVGWSPDFKQPMSMYRLVAATDPLRLTDRIRVLEARVKELEAALERIAEQQPRTLAMIEANGFVFNDIGREPGNWQHLAFSIYTDLCEVDSIARAALQPDSEER